MKENAGRLRGSSLLELIGALLISAALVLLTVPRLSQLRERTFLRLAAEKLQLEIERAYLLSRLENSRIEISAQSDSISFSRNGKILRAVPLAKGLRLSFTNRRAGEIVFYQGQSASPATLMLSTGTSSCTLTISLRGRVKLQC
ncbi:MAG: hypothetical protein K1X83_07205 [Oligoflexia bacterium]|nr:hypothetical protein [Oligoflexia bacterium]